MDRYQDAIDAIKSNYPTENYTILREGLDLAIEALKKQEMRKIVIVKVPKKWGGQVAKCPNCGEILTVPWLYCHYCGQKLDWEV